MDKELQNKQIGAFTGVGSTEKLKNLNHNL